MSDGLERDFKGVWIPADLWLDDKLTKMEMLTLVEIDSLTRQPLGCIANNAHFANFLRVSKDSAKKIISSLVSKGYIESEVTRDKKTKQVVQRRLRVSLPYGKIFPYPMVRFSPTPGGKSSPTPGGRNYPDSNTVISNTNNSNTYKEYSRVNSTLPETNEQDEALFKDIVDYLNSKAKTNYRSTTKNTRKLISGRLSEGYTVDDFKYVIDIKAEEWLNTDWEQYLKPDTLFKPTNFEKYRNQKRRNRDGNNTINSTTSSNYNAAEIEKQNKYLEERLKRIEQESAGQPGAEGNSVQELTPDYGSDTPF